MVHVPKVRPREGEGLAWWLSDDSFDHPGDRASRVWIRDPNGHVAFIYPRTDGWAIDKDGNVTPSVECMNVGCGFHDFLILDGWQPMGAKP